MSFDEKQTTHFGYNEIPISEKVHRVGEVFTSVASKYNLMNDLMSFGLHRFWKQFTVSQAGLRAGQIVLDVAGGSGDLSALFAKKVGPSGLVILTDINASMLNQGREQMLDKGIAGNLNYVQADAEQLPFPSHYFDCISIAFGLRNVTDKAAALRSMYRVLKPGGKLLVLEFSKPASTLLKKAYDLYSFNVIPKLGEWICKDKESYQYLVESIRMHPNQEQLKALMEENGFEDVKYHNLTGGIVALHVGFKY
jgi:demethylmenaquinone methyltransferase / 2-methoxy-6-polyprenyl-1,4-benzoquinol methylase